MFILELYQAWLSNRPTTSKPEHTTGRKRESTKLVLNPTERSLMDENPKDRVEEILQKLAVYLANELDKKSNLLQRIEDLENEVSDISRNPITRDDVIEIAGETNILEEDVRDWISEAIENTTVTLEP
jgi:polyhydroxyalkanoate synthesis regulator phasin